MKSNALLRFLVPAVILAIIVILIAFRKPEQPVQEQHVALSLSKEEARELGIEGDTANDTLRTLVGEMKSMRSQIQASNERNASLTSENRRFAERERALEARINETIKVAAQDAQRLKSEALQLNEQAMQLLAELQDKGSNELSIGLGLESEPAEQPRPAETIVWIEPADAVGTEQSRSSSAPSSVAGSGFAFPNVFSSLDGSVLDRSHQELKAAYKGERNLKQAGRQKNGINEENEINEIKRMFTIAEGSTLIGSVTMTALIGRVPVDGSVNDPYPFKVLIGQGNLAANGIELPDVTGAVMSGTATGDWTLSCVRGQVESITFVFADGTIRTVPEPEQVTRGRGSTTSNNTGKKILGGIGYLSDSYGIPCLAGERKSNVNEYIGNDALIYVPPHQEVAIHIDRELSIDFETLGRKVKHHENSEKGIEIYELD